MSDSRLTELPGKALASLALPALLVAICFLPARPGTDARAAGGAVFSVESSFFYDFFFFLRQHSMDEAGLRLKAILLSQPSKCSKDANIYHHTHQDF